MKNFEQLHPALQHHVVNSLGWRELRSFQDEVIPSILNGQHVIIIAPTAGGKTEAAFLPVLSRLLSESWASLSVLYVCPIKALLNNLDLRLQKYCSLVGRTSALWHGDVSRTARQKILRDPPDCLLTTPESLELMLVSPNVDERRLFSGMRAVIVDEIHAFAGDDRGWHLLAVLERVRLLAGRELQRIGLSATVGNATDLLEWLAGSCSGQRQVFQPRDTVQMQTEVQLDFVGSLDNATTVISRMHRGERRLVFVDSRARAEQLGTGLRQAGVTTFVTHSSLSQDQRRRAEDAFVNRDDCVIVATSVLELGIDVGDLDRVIQIDSPSSVSSFLQRMGRSGRRPGTTRNCLFLATSKDALLQGAAVIDLWQHGYVEPIEPPVGPYHVLAQQLMALALQERSIGRHTWFKWVAKVPAFADMDPGIIDKIVEWMISHEVLFEDQGLLAIGRFGEEAYGRRHFQELLSVFTSAPLFVVMHGRKEVGFVDELTFLGKRNGPKILLLGGRAWIVRYVDWEQRIAHVDTSEHAGASRWRGEGQNRKYQLCQMIKRVLVAGEERTLWSRRATGQIEQTRKDSEWLSADGTTLSRDGTGRPEWWTFAGDRTNASLAPALSEATATHTTFDSLSIRFDQQSSLSDISKAIVSMASRDLETLLPSVDDAALEGLKFSDCLPRDLGIQVLQMRLRDREGLARTLQEPLRIVSDESRQ